MMTRSMDVTVRFAGQGDERRPVAVLVKRPPSGTRVTVRVDPECLVTRSVYLLSRIGSDIVLMAALREEQAEAARAALGKAAEAWRVVKVEVIGDLPDA
jgi:hypothetical protein